MLRRTLSCLGRVQTPSMHSPWSIYCLSSTESNIVHLTVFEIIIGMENVSLVGTSPLTAVDPDSRLPVLPLNTRSSAIAEGPRDASCQLNSCHLPRNSAETTCTTSHEEIDVMKLEGCSQTMCNKHVHSTMTRSSRFHCLKGVINKPTTDKLWISLVYRRFAVAKFSKSSM